MPRPLELLAPAKNLESGREAILHGADAVYIGGPSFGARAAAGNSMADIARLAEFAHRYSARVLVALNTLLRDEELEDARRLAWEAYDAGADALIVQDMGLLEMDLPPLQLHASTQTDNRSVEKVRFLEQVGFSQVVLARELTLDEIRAIAAATSVTLEFFVHGALCVSYSGQCYISHAFTGRSANRGECSQMCRLPYTLSDEQGRTVAHRQHLLSLKDNDQSANLRALAQAGIRSFKIEGRLKDLSYVKNVTAHYRTLLDRLLDEDPAYCRSSAGRCTYTFTPRPEKTFNRGATDYFVTGRQGDLLSLRSPKFTGEPVGKVARLLSDGFEVAGGVELHNGDGLTWFDEAGELVGARVNRAEGRRVILSELHGGDSRPGRASDTPLSARSARLPAVGTPLYRNRDHAFERLLEKPSAERRIGVALRLAETPEGFALTLTDEEGHRAEATLAHPKEAARNPEQARATLRENLAKLGNTPFVAQAVDLDLSAPWFLPVAALNGLRREAVERLEAVRRDAWRRPPRADPVEPPAPYPESALSYLGNVANALARRFYARHGVTLMEAAFEAGETREEVSLMTTRHCLRFSFHLCPKQVKGIRPDPMTLTNSAGETLTLRFDCQRCEMHVLGRTRQPRPAGG